MSNRVYFYCTDFPALPTDEQFDEFSRLTGTEYEVAYCIPLFWLCLFSAEDIALGTGNSLDEEARCYAYLSGDKTKGLARLRAVAPMMQTILGAERYALYDEWITRIENEPFQRLLVRTEELDWMGEQGELEGELRQAFQNLQHAHQTGEFQRSAALNNITGLSDDMTPAEAPSFLLVGSANSAQDWPPRFAPPAAVAAMPKKSRWLFWK